MVKCGNQDSTTDVRLFAGRLGSFRGGCQDKELLVFVFLERCFTDEEENEFFL